MDVIIKLNVRSGTLYERLTGKNFFKINTEEESIWLMYACYVSSNKEVSFDTFVKMLENQHFASAITKAFDNIKKINSQLIQDSNGSTDNDENDEITLTDMASVLIIQYGMDAHYVYEEMHLYEIENYFKWANKKYQAEMEEKRFWAFLQLMPFGGGKMKKPDELIKFPWEHDSVKENLAKNKDLIKAVFANLRNKKIFNDGTGGTNIDNRPEGHGGTESESPEVGNAGPGKGSEENPDNGC
jgi:hypothetical protein